MRLSAEAEHWAARYRQASRGRRNAFSNLAGGATANRTELWMALRRALLRSSAEGQAARGSAAAGAAGQRTGTVRPWETCGIYRSRVQHTDCTVYEALHNIKNTQLTGVRSVMFACNGRSDLSPFHTVQARSVHVSLCIFLVLGDVDYGL